MATRTKREPGRIRDAIVQFLRDEQTEATISEIHRAVRRLLGEPVPSSSVRSYLGLNTPDRFTRVARGRYRINGGLGAALPFEDASGPEAVYEWKRVRLFQRDCVRWLHAQPTCSVHAIVTDPPYGFVEFSKENQAKLRNGVGGVWRIPPAFDGHKRSPVPRFTTLRQQDLLHLSVFFRGWANAAFRVLVPGAQVLIASNPLVSHIVSTAVGAAGFERRGQIIRLVMTMRGGDRPKNAHEEFRDVSVMMRSMHEPWLVFRKPLEGRVQDNLRRWKTGGFRRPERDRPFGDVIRSHPTHKRERAMAPHPSLKPQRFLRQIVRAVLPLGEGVVLDPFAGSGSTLAAAEAVGYRSIGVESDPAYVAMAQEAIPRLAALRIHEESHSR